MYVRSGLGVKGGADVELAQQTEAGSAGRGLKVCVVILNISSLRRRPERAKSRISFGITLETSTKLDNFPSRCARGAFIEDLDAADGGELTED